MQTAMERDFQFSRSKEAEPRKWYLIRNLKSEGVSPAAFQGAVHRTDSSTCASTLQPIQHRRNCPPIFYLPFLFQCKYNNLDLYNIFLKRLFSHIYTHQNKTKKINPQRKEICRQRHSMLNKNQRDESTQTRKKPIQTGEGKLKEKLLISACSLTAKTNVKQPPTSPHWKTIDIGVFLFSPLPSK